MKETTKTAIENTVGVAALAAIHVGGVLLFHIFFPGVPLTDSLAELMVEIGSF